MNTRMQLPVLGEVVALTLGEEFELRLFQHRRPRAHETVPLRENFGAAARPVGGGLHARTVVEEERGAVAAELAGVFGRRGEAGGDELCGRVRRVQSCRAEQGEESD